MKIKREQSKSRKYFPENIGKIMSDRGKFSIRKAFMHESTYVYGLSMVMTKL